MISSTFDAAIMVPILYFLLKVALMGWFGEKELNWVYKGKFPGNKHFSFNEVGFAALYCHILFLVAIIVYGLFAKFVLQNELSVYFFTSRWTTFQIFWYPLAPVFMGYFIRLPNGKAIGYLAGFVTTIPVIVLDLLKIAAIKAEVWPI